MSRWPMVAIGDVCQPVSRTEAPQPGKAYAQVGVQLWGRGAYARETIDGADTKYAALNRVQGGDLIVNKIWARNGSVAVVPEQLAGGYVSGEFPIFTRVAERIHGGWLGLLTAWPKLWASFDETSQGTSGKNRIKPAQILRVKIPLPSLAEQQAIVIRLDALAEKSERLTAHWQAIADDAAALLAVRFAELIADAPRRPLGEVAPLLRRPVALDGTSHYREVGARSFGKGLFIKPDFDAEAATWQKPVWVKSGDLVLSNIKAWEGAIAVASKEHDDAIASHRYLTCVPDTAQATAAFLCYFLLTPEGLQAIGHASPGTADRNRTTSPKGLQAIRVPLPPLAQQKAFDQLKTKVAALLAEQAAQREQLEQLRKQALEQAFEGAE